MTYNINALLPICEEILTDFDLDIGLLPMMALKRFKTQYPALPIPTYTEWMAAFDQLEQESTAEDDLSDLEDDGEPIPTPISCSMCQRPTTFDPTYGDLCYRCCRAGNE